MPLRVIPLARARRSNLRPSLGAFVGRDGEIGRIERMLDDGKRLVTLLGPPGIGKTRTAERLLEIREAHPESEGGAWFVELAQVDDVAGLVHAVASLWPSLDAVHLPSAEAADRIADHLTSTARQKSCRTSAAASRPAAPGQH